MKIKPLEASLAFTFFALAVLIGWLVSTDLSRTGKKETTSTPPRKPDLLTKNTPQDTNSATPLKKAQRAPQKNNLEALFALPNERLFQFGSDEEYRRFLASLEGSNLRLLGSIDSLRAVRIGYRNLSDLGDLLSEEDQGYNFLVNLPLVPDEGTIQASAVGFNGNALDWLGITGDNSAWGEGVTIAIIDSGISSHPALPEGTVHFNLADDANSTTAILNGHGTAVASLIAGQNRITPGVSPSAQLIDVRVADANGRSSSFQLAEGIITAVDSGADLINISLGTYGDSAFVQEAVDYAAARGVVIVASSGNEGLGQPAYPAAYPGVIAVGAVDREGTLLDFSNTGEALDLTAPGLAVHAAYTGDRYIEFTGTSASSPYVAAAVATAMSEFGLTAAQAVDLVIENANEAGSPGNDPSYGAGHLAVDRTVNSSTPGIHDIAAVANLLSENRDSIITVVQNQGTTVINNATGTLRTPFERIPLSISNLAPGEIQSFEFTVNLPASDDPFEVQAVTTLDPTFTDFEPSNDRKRTSFEPLSDGQ